MILVADSGSTKTNWELVDNKKNVVCFQTMGLNPFYVTKDIVKNELSLHFPSDINTNYIKDIYFYGAGCSSTERCNIIKFGIGYLFKKANIYVAHDLMGAARALFGQKDGIVAILGTGSNSCLYNGHKIISNIPSLGYVLGDEGSGAILGKKLIQSLLYNELPQYLIDKFFLKYKTNKNNLLETIYKKPYPNRFLASFTYFLSENSNDKFISDIIESSFNDFFIKHICKYNNYQNLKLRCTGSVAYYFQPDLIRIAEKYRINIDKIVKDPLKGMISYHQLTI